MNKQNPNLGQRLDSPTPKFFKVLRTIGLSLAAAVGAKLTAPVSVPAPVTTIAGYFVVIGGVLSAVSQAAVEGE